MLTLAAVLVVCGTVLLIGHQTARALVARWDADRAHQATIQNHRLVVDRRRVTVAEREMALREKELDFRIRPTDQSPPMPSDLAERCRQWEDPWAQDQEKATLMALYAEFRDWDVVRQKLTPLMPRMELDIQAPRDGMIQ